MEWVNCDLCGQSNSDTIIKQRDIIYNVKPEEYYYLQKCRNCGLVYLNPRPDIDEIKTYYKEDYYYHSYENIIKFKIRQYLTDLLTNNILRKIIAIISFPSFMHKYFPGLVRPRVHDYLASIKPCKFLDVGCGNGLNTHFWGYRSSIYGLKRKGFDAVGLEPSDNAIKIAKRYGLNVVRSFSEIESESFDCIRLNWSLEHVDSPSMIFRKVHSLLKPDGKLIIAVPNYDGILYRLFPDCVELPVHNYYFTPITLEAYLHKYGFNVLDKYTFSYPSMFTYGLKCLGVEPEVSLTPLEIVYFQSILGKFDALNMGNDMVYLSTPNDVS